MKNGREAHRFYIFELLQKFAFECFAKRKAGKERSNNGLKDKTLFVAFESAF
jgi:hypothetical protein